MPKISVLTPIYNTPPDVLRNMIDSVLAQTFADFEFLILNDSPDNSDLKKIIKSYHDKRIKYFENEKNIGISASRNKLLDLARGEYIAVMDHDDISLSHRFQIQSQYLDSHPDYGVVSGWLELYPRKKIWKNPEHNLQIKTGLMNVCVVSHTACMLRKSVLEAHKIRYEEQYSPAEDYMLFIRLMEHTMFYNFQQVLVKYKYDSEITTFKQWNKMCDRDALIRCYAWSKYPYLADEFKMKPRWIKLFFIIPIILARPRIKDSSKYYLFGFIPLFKRG